MATKTDCCRLQWWSIFSVMDIMAVMSCLLVILAVSSATVLPEMADCNDMGFNIQYSKVKGIPSGLNLLN